jgi:hypothetical protein
MRRAAPRLLALPFPKIVQLAITAGTMHRALSRPPLPILPESFGGAFAARRRGSEPATAEYEPIPLAEERPWICHDGTSSVVRRQPHWHAGSDVAFLGGLIRHVLEPERWNTEPFFREFVTHYTNAPTIIGDGFQDTEDLAGVFSGLMQYTASVKEWSLDGFVGQDDPKSRGGAGRQALATRRVTVRPAGALAARPAPAARQDPAAPPVGLPDRPAALQPLHPRDISTCAGARAPTRRCDRGASPAHRSARARGRRPGAGRLEIGATIFR